MRVIAYVSIVGFYLKALGTVPPLTVLHREKVVLDADAEARSRGVTVGMPLAEAKVVLAKEGHFVEWDEEPFRKAQEAWIARAVEITDALEPDGQHAAFLDLSGHPRPLPVAQKLALELREAMGYSVRIGLAGSRWVAKESERRGDESGAALHIPEPFVASLSTKSLPLPREIKECLGLLGYLTVGQVATLSVATLQRQFGEVALDIQRLAKGGGPADVKPVFPVAALADRFVFDGPPETLQELEAGLYKIAVRLGNRLRHDDASAKTVELFLEGEDASTDVRLRTFSKPLGGTALLFASLKLMLTTLPKERLAAVRVRLTGVKRSRRVQLALDGERSRLDQERSMTAAVENARTAFGDQAVMRGSEKVEPRFRQVRRAYSEAYGWTW